MSNSEQIIARLKYLRNSLADSERMNIHPDVKNSPRCSFEDLKAGCINKDITLALFKRHGKTAIAVDEASDSTDKSREKEEEVKSLAVLIYPLKYKRTVEYGKRKGSHDNFDFIYPLCLPAVLSRGGILSGELIPPFIPRRYLSPQSRETSFPEISSVSDQDEFFRHNDYEAVSSEIKEENDLGPMMWDKCWDYAEELWKKVVGVGLRHLEISNYVLEEGGVLLYGDLSQSPSCHIIRLYNKLKENDKLKKKKPSVPLLEAFLSPSQEKEKETLKLESSVLVNEKLIAQMNKKKSLSPSQNVVMDYFLDNKADLFLTVNGPPGTGKTTLIQSLIANIWVQAALDEKEPPIIVVSSTNNNAVTNVLESFKAKDEDKTDNPLYKRWLPNIHSFGTYCASAEKIKKKTDLKQGWLVTKPSSKIISYTDTNVSIDFKDPEYLKNPPVEDSEYIQRACIEFKKNFSEVFKEQPENMSEFLHEQLSQAVNDLQEGCTYQKPLCEPFDKSGAKEKSKTLKEDINLWHRRHKNFKDFEQELPFYIRWNRFIPVMRKIFGKSEEGRFEKFCLDEGLLDERLNNKFQNFYNETVQSFIVQQKEKSEEDLKSILDALETREKQEQQWQEWCSKQTINCNPEGLSDALNKHEYPLRWRIFYLATHYWEARWLQDMEECTNKKEKGQPDLKKLWLRRAKLSPCFAVTLYMLPDFFKQSSNYFYDFIDYLIFDESGQINTYVAAPSLALAKRAVIIGDTKQLEPICNIPEAIDKGNCKKFNLITAEKEDEEYKTFTKEGFSAAYNSLMDRAHYLCDFKQTKDLEESGFFLREHWRCVPEIAAYFNELAYSGYLEPERPSLPLKDLARPKVEDSHTTGETKEESIPKFRLYPALGYAHIVGGSENKGQSRCKRLEAQIIVNWLGKNAEEIRDCYGNKPLHEIVAIITPFKAQSSLLKAMIHKSKIDKNITIGTVHALQGAERPLIIFSLAYGSSKYGKLDSLDFIDNNVNFLNVAVSRAKDSFLVFGDMNQLDTDSGTPSGLLAKKLFADENNEILDIDITAPMKERLKPLEIEFINNLTRHRVVLRGSIKRAKKRVLITSPFITTKAIEEDELEILINEADKRGIKVEIITDHYINYKNDKSKDSTLEGREKLKKAGAVVNIRNIHDKVICVDDHTITIGSFNWLSASRAPEYAKQERSVLCHGGQKVSEEIDKHWKRIKDADQSTNNKPT